MSGAIIKVYKKKEKIIKYIAMYTLYKILLEYVYVVAVSPWYDYLGFIYTPNRMKCIVSYVLFFGVLYFLQRELSVNGQLLNTFFSISTVPMLSFYWLADKKTISVMLSVIFFLIFNCVAKFNGKKIKVFLGENFRYYDLIITIIFLSYVIVSVFFGLQRGGIDVRALSFSSIYDLRSEENSLNGIGGYILCWCAKSFFPMFTVYYLYIKKYFRVFICIACQVFLYLCYGFKAYILSIVLTIVVYFIGKYTTMHNKETNIRNLWIFLLGLVPCCLSNFNGIIGNIGLKVNNVFAMRLLFEPARISNGYYEFFTINNKLYFSEGMIGKIFGLSYPYDRPIGFIITNYLNGSQAVSNSNTGIVADSYSQVGILGTLLISMLAGLMILLIKRLNVTLPSYCIGAAFFYPIIMLNDNPLLTNILTNGWVIDIILLALFEAACREKINFRLKNGEEL